MGRRAPRARRRLKRDGRLLIGNLQVQHRTEANGHGRIYVSDPWDEADLEVVIDTGGTDHIEGQPFSDKQLRRLREVAADAVEDGLIVNLWSREETIHESEIYGYGNSRRRVGRDA